MAEVLSFGERGAGRWLWPARLGGLSGQSAPWIREPLLGEAEVSGGPGGRPGGVDVAAPPCLCEAETVSFTGSHPACRVRAPSLRVWPHSLASVLQGTLDRDLPVLISRALRLI